MSRNLSDSKQERDLYNRIARLEQQMRERGTTQFQGDDAINMQTTEPVVLTTPSDLLAGGVVIAKFSLSNTEQKMIFADFRYTVYVGNAIDPEACVSSEPLSLLIWLQLIKFTHWSDWQATEDSESGQRRVDYVLVENISESDFPITIVGQWRYIVNGGAAIVE